MDKKCILIIEDEMDILSLYKEYLENAGFEIDTAANGEEGLGKITGKKYDLVLMDVMMPKMDGLGVLQTLSEQNKKLPPIVMLSNLSHDEAIKEAKKFGVKDYIIKSDITPDELLKKVQQNL